MTEYLSSFDQIGECRCSSEVGQLFCKQKVVVRLHASAPLLCRLIGRTSDFGSDNLGSSPSGVTI